MYLLLTLEMCMKMRDDQYTFTVPEKVDEVSRLRLKFDYGPLLTYFLLAQTERA